MIEFLKNWVLSISTLVIFIILLEIIIPSGKIKKFVNLVSGFILIIAIINPFLSLFRSGVDLKQFQFSNSNFIDKSEIERDSKILKDNQMKQIVETFRNKIIYQIQECLSDMKEISEVKGDVIINEDYKSATFGEIKRVYVNFKIANKESTIKSVTKIEKVKIGGDEKKENNIKIDNAIRNNIETKINKLLGVNKDIIVINVRE